MSTYIESYIKDAPAEQQEDLKLLQKFIEDTLSGYEIVHPNKFPVYAINGDWLTGFASRSKHAMFYLMKTHILDKYENRLGKLRTGKSCIAYKKSKDISIDELNELIVKMLQEI